MSEQTDPVGYAVEKCLEYAVVFDSPASAAIDFLALLKMSHTMSDSEIAEVTRRVIDELGDKASRVRFLANGDSK